MWLSVRTQWRGAGLGVIGLDYGEVRRMAADLEITLDVPMWRKIQTLEAIELERQGEDTPGND